MHLVWKEQAKQYEAEYVETLKRFLAINSIEDMQTAREGKPFGEGVAEALDFMLELGRRDGFRTKDLEGYAGYIEYGEGEEVIGVLVHVDVVTVGDDWTTPPFSPDIRDGRVYARGAIDDKGPALAAYYALKMVKDSGVHLSKRVRFIIGTDEESGWLCMKRYNELERMPETGFSPDAEFPLIHAEKGQINPTITLDEQRFASAEAETANSWVLSKFVSGDQGNSVPEKATAWITVPDGVDCEKLAAEFEQFLRSQNVTGEVSFPAPQQVRLFVKGVSVHGMQPNLGINAGTTLASFLLERPFVARDQAFLHFLGEVLHQDYYGEKLGVACEDEVTGKLTVNPGILRYDRAEGAEVKLNIRYPATISMEERRDIVERQLAGFGWITTNMRTSKAHYVPADHPTVSTLTKVYEEHTGQKASLLSTGGATYAKMMPAGVAYGALFPGREGTAHQKDEYAEIGDLLAAMAIYAHAISELAK
ncbi:dipeptidase PepV [Brevibacillus sp. TJ4]|uniref:dipeptidase PepV n=1 Tax=Brevibacillus sp. TJ4 TaxID=3234853 RepID=UPI0037D29B09